MPAKLILRRRRALDELSFEAAVIWRVPVQVLGSKHDFKYRLAFVVNGLCVLRYDNEAGKGDHRHFGDLQEVYVFTTLRQLLVDFRNDIAEWRRNDGDSNF